jgi:hypothetical protein
MILSYAQLGLVGFLRLLTTAVVAGSMSSPMSWSPDGEWLSYTILADGDQNELRPGWILRMAATPSTEPADGTGPAARGAGGPAVTYRIWATHRNQKPSVLIEESRWPVSAPAWSPRGKSVAFGRFVPQSLDPAQPVPRGRYEVVIQDGLDQKNVVWSSPEFGLDPVGRAAMPLVSCSWSPDGLYLAIPRVGGERAVEIIRTDNRKRVQILDHASLPAWSPDGAKCAFIRHDNHHDRLEYVERRGQTFGEPRMIATLGPINALPHWTGDSRAIYAVAEKVTSRSRELEIVRFGLDPSDSHFLFNLAPEATRRGAKIRGLAIDFDRDAERCFYSVDLEGRDSDVVWCLPRDRWEINKRFHPLDVSQRIEGVSIAPDGQVVAMRFGTPTGLTPPALYDTETEQTKLLVPDDDSRREWLGVLAGATRHILMGSLPAATADGQAAERPTLLPLPGELPTHDLALVRLNRLAKLGSELCVPPADQTAPAERHGASAFDSEARLFFEYLRGDYRSAMAGLANLESFLSSPRERLSLLSVRAQILWARGESSEARAAIDFLLSCGEPNRRLVEETPFGLVFSPAISPQRAWAHYLSARAADGLQARSPADGDPPANVAGPRLQDPFGAPEAPINDRGAGPIPFAPFAPVREVP